MQGYYLLLQNQLFKSSTQKLAFVYNEKGKGYHASEVSLSNRGNAFAKVCGGYGKRILFH